MFLSWCSGSRVHLGFSGFGFRDHLGFSFGFRVHSGFSGFGFRDRIVG